MDASPISSLIELESDPIKKQRIWEAYWLGCAEGYATCFKVLEDKKRNVSHQEGNVVYLKRLTNQIS